MAAVASKLPQNLVKNRYRDIAACKSDNVDSTHFVGVVKMCSVLICLIFLLA